MIVGGDLLREKNMKILGLGDVLEAGTVVQISRDFVILESNGQRCAYTLANIEKMVFSN